MKSRWLIENFSLLSGVFLWIVFLVRNWVKLSKSSLAQKKSHHCVQFYLTLITYVIIFSPWRYLALLKLWLITTYIQDFLYELQVLLS